MDQGAIEEPLLCVRGLEAGYGDVQVLWGVDLDVLGNSIVSVVGPNGAGKTTLLLALSGMVRVKGGSWRFRGKELRGCSPDQIVSEGISHVPEGRRLFRTLSVRDNLLLGAYHRGDRGGTEHDSTLCSRRFQSLRSAHTQDANTLSGGNSKCVRSGAASWRGRSS